MHPILFTGPALALATLAFAPLGPLGTLHGEPVRGETVRDETARGARVVTPTPFVQEAESEETEPQEAEDVADVPWEARLVHDDEHMLYHLIGHDAEAEAPEDGYRLLVVLPGGDGQAGFRDFVRRIEKHALDEPWIVAQLVAPVWGEDQEVVWTSEELPHDDMEFTTGDFIAAVIDDVEEAIDIDPNYVFTMGWSSSGTEVYRSALEKDTKVTGAFVSMSVWKPDLLPKLKYAKKRAFAILHSPEDFIPIRMAEEARDELEDAKALVHYATYEGGHGWRDDPYGNMRRAIAFLEENHADPPKRKKKRR